MFTARDEVHTLFPIQEIFRITVPAENKEFFNKIDFEYIPGTRIIRRLPGSRMPYITQEMLHPAADAICFPEPGSLAIGGACDGGKLLFNNGNFFAKNQICVDYRATEIDFIPELDPQQNRLPRFRQKLAAGEDIKITLLGDSISDGFNATSFTGTFPYLPPYIEQVCRNLNDVFRVQVTLKNRAVNGTGCKYAEEIYPEWENDQPDLLIIAHGMNDFHAMSAEEFISVHRRLMELCRKKTPECEFLMVTSMTGNPVWKGTLPGNDSIFAEAMRQFVAGSDHSTALADVQKVWRKILEYKDFYDINGNGVNHPNDYGHAVYASVITQLLCGIEMF